MLKGEDHSDLDEVYPTEEGVHVQEVLCQQEHCGGMGEGPQFAETVMLHLLEGLKEHAY